ncbi:hypothetical protein AVEN_223814-1 [Araneus ventricosus]|uniref:Uncharacterized protein n=1 Tax=Araneus ventricosus TaxID=182803 RepID=A0A4Y2DN58_ARAVE|nr:hypothetical protein AVEN_223814-1 [Araneus ventricosus]
MSSTSLSFILPDSELVNRRQMYRRVLRAFNLSRFVYLRCYGIYFPTDDLYFSRAKKKMLQELMVTLQSSVAEISQTGTLDGSSTIVESWSSIIHFFALSTAVIYICLEKILCV